MSEIKKRGLGRGFDSLIPTGLVETEFDVTAKTDNTGHRTSSDTIHGVDPYLVDPNPHQPRKNFDPDALEALAASIRVHGILQPLVMSQVGSRYELIAGERRLRAAKIAGLDRVPAIIRSFDEQAKLELAIIENIQRAELNPIELATAYRKLMDQFNQTYEDIGKKVGRDHTTIANVVRLLNLPLDCKHALIDEVITEGHARALLALREEHKQLELLALIKKHKWNVRQAEEFARGYKGEKGSKLMAQARINEIEAWQKDLGEYLGTKVVQKRQAKGRGKIIIEYYSEEELDRIYRLIRHDQ
jgi:ParB family transcriptional regulator, chromosome partitioning protein